MCYSRVTNIHLLADDTLIYYHRKNYEEVVGTKNIKLKLFRDEVKSMSIFLGSTQFYYEYLRLKLDIVVNDQMVQNVQRN